MGEEFERNMFEKITDIYYQAHHDHDDLALSPLSRWSVGHNKIAVTNRVTK